MSWKNILKNRDGIQRRTGEWEERRKFPSMQEIIREWNDRLSGKWIKKVESGPFDWYGEDARYDRVFNQINDLIPENVKTRNDFLEFFTDPKRNAELGKALGPGGIIDNVVKQKTVGGEYQRTIDEVRDRVMNFNPEAVREDGTVVGREGFVESIFANIGFGRMEARKELAIEAKKNDLVDFGGLDGIFNCYNVDIF